MRHPVALAASWPSVAVTMCFTVIFIVGAQWQVLSFVTLAALALAAYNFPKIGTDYMPPLDEGSILDMPVTVPRASVTQAADDLKARDALLRRFPEVEMVVGKAGRADTPTDPSPLGHGRERHHAAAQGALAQAQARRTRTPSSRRPWCWRPCRARPDRADPEEPDRRALLDPATMNAVDAVRRGDARIGAPAVPRLRGGARADSCSASSSPSWSRRWQTGRPTARAGRRGRHRPPGRAVAEASSRRSCRRAGQEDVNRLIQRIAEKLAAEKKVELNPELLTAKFHPLYDAYLAVASVLGVERPTLFTADVRLHRARSATRTGASRSASSITRSSTTPWPPIDWYAIEELHKLADEQGPLGREDRRRGRAERSSSATLRAELDAAWSPAACSCGRRSKDDLLKEMDSVVQMPGWANIWTQPIINRIDMLATGVRTMIGVKVFGNDLDKIQEVSEQVADVLKQIPGAVDVFPDQTVGKGYLEIKIDRQKAARYGVNVGDIQDVIETALGGKAITMTVEGRERFPVRIRYARAFARGRGAK